MMNDSTLDSHDDTDDVIVEKCEPSGKKDPKSGIGKEKKIGRPKKPLKTDGYEKYLHSDIVAFISRVESHQVLWDACTENGLQRQTQRKLFDEIEKECSSFMPRGKNVHGTCARNLWNNLLFEYQKAKNEVGTSNLLDFEYSKEMAFLDVVAEQWRVDNCYIIGSNEYLKLESEDIKDEDIGLETPNRKRRNDGVEVAPKKFKSDEILDALFEEVKKTDENILMTLNGIKESEGCESEKICKMFKGKTHGWSEYETLLAEAKVMTFIAALERPGAERDPSNFSQTRHVEFMPTLLKKFVLKHTFENVSNVKEDERVYSEEEKYFGVPWRMFIIRKDGHLAFFLNCPKSLKVGKWSILAELELKIISKTEKVMKDERLFGTELKFMSCGCVKFIEWEEMNRDYLIDDKLNVEAHVTIKGMTGFEKAKLRSFDENELTDVALIVGNNKFHVVKKLLAYQSTYFKSLFLGNFDESKKSEVILKDIDSQDFQNFLELIHGESAIDDNTIDGILHLADMYDSPVVIRRCEEFLMKDSKMTMKKKLQLSTKYKLENLKNKCISEIDTVKDIRLAAAIEDIEHSTTKALLQKSLSLH